MSIEPTTMLDKRWGLSVSELKSNPVHFDFINVFMDLIEPKLAELSAIGVLPENITVWMYFFYDEQCNMEFDPADLARLGSAGIKLCISCFESKIDESDDEEVEGENDQVY